MRMPETNSRAMRILQAFRRKPMTLDQGMEAHGIFNSRALPDGVERTAMLKMYSDLVARGCLVKEGVVYRLHLACLYKLEAMDLRCKPDAGAMTAPAPRNTFRSEDGIFSSRVYIRVSAE